mgnify:CR=1 FL=1
MDVNAHNSKYTKQYWENRGVCSKNNVVIYNGVPFVKKHDKNNAYIDFPELKNSFIVGTTSRLIPWKRVDILINAFSMTKYKENMKLLLVGDGPERKNLDKLVEKNAIQNLVIFTGYKSNVTDYQDVLDLSVFPSVSEPFGLVAIECLLLGKPVYVMDDGGGITELIEDIEPQNVAKSIEHLTKLLDKAYEDQETSKLSASNRMMSTKKYSVSNTEAKYAKLYQKII